MATGNLSIRSNRIGPIQMLQGDAAGVALDATLDERFRLPSGFGDLWIDYWQVDVEGFSGAYVAPAPAYDGLNLVIYSSDSSTIVDILGCRRFVNSGTQTTRPVLAVSMEMMRRTILYQGELLAVTGPVLAGAAVTGGVHLRIRGLRTKND